MFQFVWRKILFLWIWVNVKSAKNFGPQITSPHIAKKYWVGKSQLSKLPHLQKVHKSYKFGKFASLKIYGLTNLFAGLWYLHINPDLILERCCHLWGGWRRLQSSGSGSFQTWGCRIKCLHYKPVSNHFCSRGEVKSFSRGDCEKQGGKTIWFLSQLHPRIPPIATPSQVRHMMTVQYL